jgi:hypothetical protein
MGSLWENVWLGKIHLLDRDCQAVPLLSLANGINHLLLDLLNSQMVDLWINLVIPYLFF